MLRQIIFLFLFTKIYANSNNPGYLKLHCTFSKHMLTFFQLNEKYFLLSTKQNVENVTYMDHLKYYGENLKTQGVIVMSMLDELRTKGFKEFPADLMTVNLYLNNVMGHIYMYSDIEDIKGKRVISEEERLRQGFVINYGLIVNHLVKVLNEKCGSLSLYLIQLEKRFQFLSNISEECTKPFRTDDIQVIHNCLENLKTLASNTFHITVQRGSFSDYHPSNLLFFDLLNPYSKFNDQFVIDDGLNSMRMVRVKSHLNNEANIINLYETALFNFDGYYLKSFQQQVLVATLYPLLKVIITFLNMFTQMYENSFEDQFKDNITQRSVKIKSIISKLTHQNLYIYKINKYLNNISNDLSNIYYLSTYKPGWIYNLKSDIANIVTLNKLEINQEDTTTRYITKDDCLELLKNTQEEINMIEKYVDDLLLKKDVLLIVKDTINHNDILDIEPINVLNTRLTGSFNHYDENKLFSKPNPEDVKVNNRNRKKRGKTSKNNISKNKISNENQNEHTSCSDMTDNIHKHDFNTINFNENNNASNSLTNKINSKKDSEPNSNDFVVVNIINENEKSNQNNKILDKSNSSNDKAYKNTPGILSTNKNFNKGKNKVLDIINNINEKAMKNIKLNENNSNSSCQTDNKSTPNCPTDNLNSNKNKEQNSESYSKKAKSNGIISDLNEEKMQDANSNSSEKKSTVKDIISNINKKEMKDIKLNENNSNSSCQTDNKSTPNSPTDNLNSNKNKEQNSESFSKKAKFNGIISDLNEEKMQDANSNSSEKKSTVKDIISNINKKEMKDIKLNENNSNSSCQTDNKSTPNSPTDNLNSNKNKEQNSESFSKKTKSNGIISDLNEEKMQDANSNSSEKKSTVKDIISNINKKEMKDIKLNENNSNSSCQTDNKSTPNSPTDNLNSNKNKEQNSESFSKKTKSNGIISDLNEEKMQDANSNSSEKKSTVKDIISNINKKEMKDIKLNENNSNSSCQTDNKSTPSSPTDNIKSNRNKEQNSNSFNNNLNFSNIINDLNGKLMRDMIFDENCQYFNKQNYSESISNNTSNSVKNYKNEDQISSDPDKKSMVSDIINDLNKKSKKDVDQNNVNFENKSVTKNSLSNFNSSIINSELEQKNSVDSTNKSSVLHIISNLNERSKNDKNNLEIKGSTKGSKKDSNDKSIGLSTIKKTSKDNEKNNHILNKNHRFSKTNKPVESNQMARVKKFNSVKKTNNDDDIESIIGQSNYNELGIDCRLDRHYNLTNSKSNDVRAPKEPMKIFPTRKNKPTGSHVSRLLDIYNELVENQFKNQNETLEKPNSDSYSSKTKNVLNQVNNIEKILKKLQNKKPNRDFGSTNKLLEDNNSQKIVISLNKPMKKNKDATSLNCLFIKFTLKFLQLNEQLFLTRHSKNGIEIFTSDNLINYDSNLQFQSEYILAMLDELRTVQSDIFASELMSVNLYINNLQGKLKIDSLKNNNIQLKRKEFINNYKMINERLSKFTNLKCQTLKEPNIDERFKDLKCYVDQISRIEITSLSTKKIIESLQLLKYHSFSTFKKSLDNGTYHDFHPTNILFYDLMTGSAAFDVSTNFYAFKETNERLNSLREVVLSVNNNVEIKNTIVELFYCASSNYNAEYTKSFQQQVLAATVYPVFKCISHYLLAFKKIYCDRNTPMKSTEAMINIGTSMRYNVKTFIELDLFANKPTEYLINMFDKFNDILNKTTNDTIKFMQPEKVSELLLMCTKPMQLNQLEFNVDDKFSNILSKNIYKTVIQEINNEVNEISKYIQSLTLHENLFKIIKRSIPHDDIFEIQPLNFMQKCILDRINKNGEENK
ncbi:MATH and LRR domain-containing protein PFE0570w-like [Daktulosphaira vitifoliae]|uniref:MATH and LRR domain-containing protein PFE0570w-like n=1 Tax=Daktulosphaira vitifoliae TaxID=58002 RepID=UPI0021A98FB3|nr:MATH and LRR domain-containing protein PFE0570w-like [Daktulosphaira vitifoliae]